MVPVRSSALALSLVFSSIALAQTRVMQPADIADLRTIAEPKISPDGHLVAYTVHTPTPAGKPHDEHIWIVPTQGEGKARLFVAGSGEDTSPAWSPDGRHIAFLSNRPNPLAAKDDKPGQKPTDAKPGEKTPPDLKPAPPTVPEPTTAEPDAKDMQLWWIPIDGGEAEPLTNLPGGIRSFKWSKDGTHIAFLRTDPDSPAELARKKIKDDRNLIDHEYHFARLWILDLPTKQSRLLTHADENVDTIDWSPDGATILSRVSPTPRIDDYWRVSKVVLYDTSTGATRQVIEPVSGYQQPTFSQDGQRIAFSRFTPRRITDVHLVRTLATGAETILEDKLKGTLAELHWMPNNHLFVNAYVAAHTEAVDFDTTSLTAKPLPNLPATALDFDLTPDASTLTFLGETPAHPAEVSVWSPQGAHVLTETNPQVAQWSLGTEREVSWTNPTDHKTIYGVLSLPPGYTPGTRYKTVIHLHGGPEEAFTVGFNATWYNYAALLASQGYVVLQPNYRGSAGQQVAFTEANYKDWGFGDFADVMAGADWAIKEGFSDPDQLAIAGWSYGGYLTSWAITHTNRFKAAMAGAAITDVFTMAITTDIAPSYLDSYMGPLDAAEYDRHSAIRNVAACHTPVLILHGQSDVRVPTSQGQEFYNALKALHRPTQMVTYPREPHIFSEREHQIDSLTRELKWFDTYLAAPKASTP